MGFCLLGIGDCDNGTEVINKFSKKTDVVNKLLTETKQETAAAQSAAASAVNKAEVGDRNLSGVKVDGKLDASTTIQQTAEAKVTQSVAMMIEAIMKSDADSDVKLDAMSTITNAMKTEDSGLTKTSSKDETEQITNVENISESISKMSTTMNQFAESCATNEIKVGNLTLKDVVVGKDGKIDVSVNTKQIASAYSEQIADLVGKSETVTKSGQKAEIIDKLTKTIETEHTGTLSTGIKTLGEFGNKVVDGVGGFFKGLGMIPIIIACIVLVLILGSIYLFRSKATKGGYTCGYDSGYDSEYDD